LAIGRNHWIHAAILAVTIVGATAATLMAFPEKLLHYALRIPGIAPVLTEAGWSPPNFTLIDRGTTDSVAMNIAFDQISLAGILDGFLLPYAGTLILALLLFRMAGEGLRILWIVPLYFIWLAAIHYLGLAGRCDTCLPAYASGF